MFGGRDVGCTALNDTWVLEDDNGLGAPTWTQLTPTGPLPPGRHFHSAVYDQATNRMIVFGGEGACTANLLNDVWVLSDANGIGSPAWTQLLPAGGPSARAEHSAVYIPASNRMILFAGNPAVGFCGNTVNDVWALDYANGLGGSPTWTQLTVSGGPPLPRGGHFAGHDAVNDLMIIFGGNQACGAHYDDVWTLGGAAVGASATWTELFPTGGPGGRSEFAGIYSLAHNRMTIFGGGTPTTFVDDTWVLDGANGIGAPPAWTLLAPLGSPPARRFDHAAISTRRPTA